jgi:hypothetical protein
MKTNLDPERQQDEALLDAMLRDDTWQTASAAFKCEALNAFHAGHRLRRVRRRVIGVAVVMGLIATGVYFSNNPDASPQLTNRPLPASIPTTPLPPPPPPSEPEPQHLTDQELLAAFPKGSCFIAEVDGKKELVFLDPQLAKAYLARQ